MRRIRFALFGVLFMASGLFASQPPRETGGRAVAMAEAPRGAPQNRWRYQYSGGRWWYLTHHGRWSYFDGSRWRTLDEAAGYERRPVDPARLRIEYKEGVLGYRRWPRVKGGGAGSVALPLSGTQGSLGGAPSGSFTPPGGVPSAMNTSTGTSTGVDGLGAGGRPSAGSGLGGGF